MVKKDSDNIFELYPDAVPLEVAIQEHLPRAAVLSTERGHLKCYFGYRPSTVADSETFYNIIVAHKHADSVEEGRLVSLTHGALQWEFDPFGGFTEHYYIPSIHLSFPRKTNPYFCVTKGDEDDKELTELFFGLCFEDLQTLIEAYEEAAGHKNKGSARITCSLKQNTCDLTGALIPREFPYLTFAGSEFIWSHISLSGFYAHVGFLMMLGAESPFYRRLLAVGCDTALIDRVRALAPNYRAIVSQEVAC